MQDNFLSSSPSQNTRAYVVGLVLLLSLVLVVGAGWYVYDTDAPALSEETVGSSDALSYVPSHERFLYFSAVSVDPMPDKDPDSMYIYALDLENENLHEVSRGVFYYNLAKLEEGLTVSLTPFSGELPPGQGTPEVPTWYDLENKQFDNYSVPFGYYKHNLRAGGDYIAYQQRGVDTHNDDTDDTYYYVRGWDVVVHNVDTDVSEVVEGAAQPHFWTNEGGGALFLLRDSSIDVIDNDTRRTAVVHQVAEPFRFVDQLGLSSTQGVLVLVTGDGHEVFSVTRHSNGEFALESQGVISGLFGSVYVADTTDHYYIVDNAQSSDGSVVVQMRASQTGGLVEEFVVPGMEQDTFYIDTILPDLITEKYLE